MCVRPVSPIIKRFTPSAKMAFDTIIKFPKLTKINRDLLALKAVFN